MCQDIAEKILDDSTVAPDNIFVGVADVVRGMVGASDVR
jgi:hypothetical protein